MSAMTPMSMPSNLSALPVEKVLHRGVIDCPPQTPLRRVAELMAENSIHCVVVDGLARGADQVEHLVWGIVSDVDLMRAAGVGRLDDQASQIAVTEIVTITPDEDVERAAQLMGEHDCSHLIVTAPDTGSPLGVISSLDVARALVSAESPGGHRRVV
jgi:CBS domain-containing protein